MKLGHFFIALDPTVVRDLDAFKTDVGRYIDQIKSQQPRAGVTEIRVPGELESIAKRKHERDGIQLNEDAVRGVRSLAERYDCAPPAGLSDSS
jgi:LDH2 family malate/lactate/ureidoglycolate dehydrogenase